MAKLSTYFWWLQWVDKIIIAVLWWAILMGVIVALPFTRPWWWVFLPLFLAAECEVLYMWWIQWDFNQAKKKWVMIEIIPPKEILTPLKAMEDVLAVVWSLLYGPPTWRERYCEGMLVVADSWMSFEIVSIEGKVHFYARMDTPHRNAVESALYAHYPELEIHEVEDYTKAVPQNMPNADWEIYGEDFILGGKSNVYPIKTYEKFFEPQGEKIAAEEKRIDPLASLLESMTKLGKGEQFWLQFILLPVDPMRDPSQAPHFADDAKKIVTKLTRRPVKHKKTWFDILFEIGHSLIAGPVKEGSGEKAEYKWLQIQKTEGGEEELMLSPGEREQLSEIERKLSKSIFRTVVRGVYCAPREHYKSGNRTIPRSYFAHFQSQGNYIRFSSLTRPKTHYFFRKRIPFLRARRQFRNYVARLTPFFPDREKECMMLNIEELTTLFHFPLKVTGVTLPTIERVESKKGGPPPNLPTE